MELSKACPLEQAAAGFVRPFLGLEPFLAGTEEAGTEKQEAPSLLVLTPLTSANFTCSLSATLIQTALWKKHVEHPDSYI